jgi:hypothetical protein
MWIVLIVVGVLIVAYRMGILDGIMATIRGKTGGVES